MTPWCTETGNIPPSTTNSQKRERRVHCHSAGFKCLWPALTFPALPGIIAWVSKGPEPGDGETTYSDSWGLLIFFFFFFFYILIPSKKKVSFFFFSKKKFLDCSGNFSYFSLVLSSRVIISLVLKHWLGAEFELPWLKGALTSRLSSRPPRTGPVLHQRHLQPL